MANQSDDDAGHGLSRGRTYPDHVPQEHTSLHMALILRGRRAPLTPIGEADCENGQASGISQGDAAAVEAAKAEAFEARCNAVKIEKS